MRHTLNRARVKTLDAADVCPRKSLGRGILYQVGNSCLFAKRESLRCEDAWIEVGIPSACGDEPSSLRIGLCSTSFIIDADGPRGTTRVNRMTHVSS